CSACSRQQCGVPQAPTSYSGADSQYQSSPTLAAFAEGASVPPFSSGVGGPKAHDYSGTATRVTGRAGGMDGSRFPSVLLGSEEVQRFRVNWPQAISTSALLAFYHRSGEPR